MSIRFHADNDLKRIIVDSTLRREPSIDFQTGQAAGLDAVVALPRLALERFHIALERVLSHLADTAGNLQPGLGKEAVDKELRVLCDPGDPVHALRRATASADLP